MGYKCLTVSPPGVINVKAPPFYAKGDDKADDRKAIQDAINTAATHSLHPNGATLFFPKGTYYINGSLVIPRLPFYRTVNFMGAGQTQTILTNRVAPNIGPLIKSDTLDKDMFGAYLYFFEKMTLNVRKNQSAVSWTANEIVSPTGAYRLHATFRDMLFSTPTGSTAPLIYIENGSRIVMDRCAFAGATGTGGYGVSTTRCGGLKMRDCLNTATAGAMLNMQGGGEVLIENCRSEGSWGTPNWRFVNCVHLTLIQIGTEGEGEGPALYYFENCVAVNAINLGVALPDAPYVNDKIADGISFVNCKAVDVQGVYANAFSGTHDGTAKVVRIDSNCRGVKVRNLYNSGIGGPSMNNEVSVLGQNCSVEMISGVTGEVVTITS